MQKATETLFEILVAQNPSYQAYREPLYILCGMGNNGGDGLLLAAQWQKQFGQESVKVLLPLYDGTRTAEHEKAYDEALLAGVPIVEYKVWKEDLLPEKGGIVLDALLGYGQKRKMAGLLADTALGVNQWRMAGEGRAVWSIDLPTGLGAEAVALDGACVKADRTYTFEGLKPCFLFSEFQGHIGDSQVVGIDLQIPDSAKALGFYRQIDCKVISRAFPDRERFVHKGKLGHALLAVGSAGMYGAGLLAAQSALCMGIGKLSCLVPRGALEIFQMQVPEAMIICDASKKLHTELLAPLSGYSAIGVGPGLGRDVRTALWLQQLIAEATVPIVLDADALHLLASWPDKDFWLSQLPKGSIITPHLGEARKLFGEGLSHFELMQRSRALAVMEQLYVVLKGPYTLIARPDGLITVNLESTTALARGGSGDLLTGIITGLLARTGDSHLAAEAGVYLHAQTAIQVVKKHGLYGYNAKRFVRNLPKVIRQMVSADATILH